MSNVSDSLKSAEQEGAALLKGHQARTSQSHLIALLADGAWHSGEALGERLGVSRAAISKQIKQLDSLGLAVETVKGTGYRLSAPLNLLEHAKMAGAFSLSQSGLQSLDVFQSIDSTNSELMRRLRSGASIHASACVAEQQNAGRGRRGRQWYSPFAQNIYLSLGWHFQSGVAVLEGLSLAVGVVICQVLERLGLQSAGLKWPNDVLVDRRKLGGVLIELGGDAVSECVAVVGIGLNVSMTLAKEVDQPWVSLSELGCDIDRNKLTSLLLVELTSMLASYSEEGFSAWSSEWNARNAYKGMSVELHSASNVVVGEMRGVDASGNLILRIGSEERRFVGGELSLRVAS